MAVGSPAAARRLLGRDAAALAEEPLIGEAALWNSWFAAAGVDAKVRPVADFNDGGLMLQAAEAGLGITLAREMFAADPIAEGRLVRLSPVSIAIPDSRGYFLVYPPALRDWPPLAAFRGWLQDELARAQREMKALREHTAGGQPAKRRAAAPQGSQSQATAPGAAPALTRRARPKAPVAGRRVRGARTTQRAQRKPCTARAARDA